MEAPETRTVKEVIEKLLKERDSEEKERQNRRKNIIVFELPESKKPKLESIIKITSDQGMIECEIRLGKGTDDKK